MENVKRKSVDLLRSMDVQSNKNERVFQWVCPDVQTMGK